MDFSTAVCRVPEFGALIDIKNRLYEGNTKQREGFWDPEMDELQLVCYTWLVCNFT